MKIYRPHISRMIEIYVWKLYSWQIIFFANVFIAIVSIVLHIEISSFELTSLSEVIICLFEIFHATFYTVLVVLVIFLHLVCVLKKFSDKFFSAPYLFKNVAKSIHSFTQIVSSIDGWMSFILIFNELSWHIKNHV